MDEDEAKALLAVGASLQKSLAPRIAEMRRARLTIEAGLVVEEIARATAEERRKVVGEIVSWLAGPHYGSDTQAWIASVRPLFDEIAADIEKRWGQR